MHDQPGVMPMSQPSVKYLCPEHFEWQRVDVYGAAMDKAVVFEGAHDVRSAFFKMAAGCTIPSHKHTKWVQAMVLDGCMLVQQEGTEPFRAKSGSVYFVNPGFSHVETAESNSLLLVTRAKIARVGSSRHMRSRWYKPPALDAKTTVQPRCNLASMGCGFVQ
jgi:quercetin dioxygenase-like cupin family protein